MVFLVFGDLKTKCYHGIPLITVPTTVTASSLSKFDKTLKSPNHPLIWNGHNYHRCSKMYTYNSTH